MKKIKPMKKSKEKSKLKNYKKHLNRKRDDESDHSF